MVRVIPPVVAVMPRNPMEPLIPSVTMCGVSTLESSTVMTLISCPGVVFDITSMKSLGPPISTPSMDLMNVPRAIPAESAGPPLVSVFT